MPKEQPSDTFMQSITDNIPLKSTPQKSSEEFKIIPETKEWTNKLQEGFNLMSTEILTETLEAIDSTNDLEAQKRVFMTAFEKDIKVAEGMQALEMVTEDIKNADQKQEGALEAITRLERNETIKKPTYESFAGRYIKEKSGDSTKSLSM